MIICNELGIGFVHIPKNGGTSVRFALRDFDSLNGAFDLTRHHDQLGKTHKAHIPLKQLKEFFPAEYEMLVSKRTYALYRDPASRFASALSQRMRGYRGLKPESLDATQIRREADIVIEHLQTHRGFHDYEFMHFTRQSDFVFLDGEQVIQQVFPLRDIGVMIADIERVGGVKLPREVQTNKSAKLRSGTLEGPVQAIKTFMNNNLPRRLVDRIKLLVAPVLLVEEKNVSGTILQDPGILDFIKVHYAEDYRIKALVASAQPA